MQPEEFKKKERGVPKPQSWTRVGLPCTLGGGGHAARHTEPSVNPAPRVLPHLILGLYKGKSKWKHKPKSEIWLKLERQNYH